VFWALQKRRTKRPRTPDMESLITFTVSPLAIVRYYVGPYTVESSPISAIKIVQLAVMQEKIYKTAKQQLLRPFKLRG